MDYYCWLILSQLSKSYILPKKLSKEMTSTIYFPALHWFLSDFVGPFNTTSRHVSCGVHHSHHSHDRSMGRLYIFRIHILFTMGLVDWPTWMVNFYGKLVGKYTSPMDPMGMSWNGTVFVPLIFAPKFSVRMPHSSQSLSRQSWSLSKSEVFFGRRMINGEATKCLLGKHRKVPFS